MIEHTLYSLNLRESQIVADYLIPQIGLARQAAERLFAEDAALLPDIFGAIDRTERRYDTHNLASTLNNPELDNDPRYSEGPGSRYYGQPQDTKSIDDLAAVAMLVLAEASRQSDPGFWEKIGLPHAKSLAEMRTRTATEMTSLIVSLTAMAG